MKNQPAWWNCDFKYNFFNAAGFVSDWENYVLQMASGKTKNKNQESALQQLSDQSKNLWKSFTTDRSELDRDYMSTEKFFAAYLASFLIPNIERTRHIFNHPRNESFMRSLCDKDEITILDFGSGPLSSSLGFVIALEQVVHRSGKPSRLIKLKIIAAERSEKAVQVASQWLKKNLLNSVECEVNRVTSVPKDTVFDVILASNVINEIPKKHQLTTIKNLLSCFHENTNQQKSQLLVVEPAQEDFARGLSALRDDIVRSPELSHIKIEAPCLHHLDCPLSAKMNRRDWCWSKVQFDRPPFLAELDRRTDIDHSVLAYSYLLLSNSTKGTATKAKAISVSDEMLLAGDEGKAARFQYFKSNQHKNSNRTDKTIEKLSESCSKLKLCTIDGELLAGLRPTAHGHEPMKRGSLIESFEGFESVVLER